LAEILIEKTSLSVLDIKTARSCNYVR